MNADLKELATRTRRRRADIERFCYRALYPRLAARPTVLCRNRHAREWWRLPMNYVRIMEVPLAIELLDLSEGQPVLDVSSPKLASLYLATRVKQPLHMADLLDYFVTDFRELAHLFGCRFTIELLDARCLPFADATFDRVFSISVLEHIPDRGDSEAFREMVRVLRPGGIVVVTLPSYHNYLEEWVRQPDFYWKGHTAVEGSADRVFYQRRYDVAALRQRFGDPSVEMADAVFIAERPLGPTRISDDGMLLHNAWYVQQTRLSRLASRVRWAPLLRYLVQRRYSDGCHYLTRDGFDPNVRQVAVKFIRRR